MIDAAYTEKFPGLVREFLLYSSYKSSSTRDAYTWDMKTFLDYIQKAFHFENLSDVTDSALLSVSEEDVENYGYPKKVVERY